MQSTYKLVNIYESKISNKIKKCGRTRSRFSDISMSDYGGIDGSTYNREPLPYSKYAKEASYR